MSLSKNHPKKAAFIGCGNIAKFHAESLNLLGIKIVSVAFKKNKKKAIDFSKKYNIAKIYDDWEKMLEFEAIDYLWVLTSPKETDKNLHKILNYKIPTFIEKPIALSSERIKRIISENPKYNKNIQVGFNRRFYDIVSILKTKLIIEDVSYIELNIPETETDNEIIENENLKILSNSIHIFDLLFFILGGLPKIERVNTFRDTKRKTKGYFVNSFFKGIPIYIKAVFNSPTNSFIKIFLNDNSTMELSPIEKYSEKKGFAVVEPNSESPIRKYVPKKNKEIYEACSYKLKPGFHNQTKKFINTFTKTPYNVEGVPNLKQSLEVLNFVEEIINFLK